MMRVPCYTLICMLTGISYVGAVENNALLLESDANSFFEAPNHDVFHVALGNQMTVEAWIYVTDQAGERMVINKEDSYELGVIDGVFQSALHAGGGWAWFNSALQVELEEWTHVAMTWDGKDVRMFVNGKEGTKSPTAGNALNVTDSTFKVGRRVRGVEGVHSIFDGLVDEVRISDVVRYDGDFNVPAEGFEPDDNTTTLYHFDEAIGGKTIEDFSASGVDGKLVGKATLVPSAAPSALAVEALSKLATVWGKLKAN